MLRVRRVSDFLGGTAGDESLSSALESVQGASRREDAVSALIALLKGRETTTAIALLQGFSQSVRLYEDAAPLQRPYWQQQYAEGRTDSRSLDFETLAEAARSPTASRLVKAHIGNLVLSYRTDQTEIGGASVEAYLDLASDPQLDYGFEEFLLDRIDAYLGERDRAVSLLQKAQAAGVGLESASSLFKYDSPLLALRDYPPFQELIRPRD